MKPFGQIRYALRACLALIALLLLVACAAVGPDYVPPQPQVPGQWHGGMPGDRVSQNRLDPELSAWWRHFDDPLLAEFIDAAVDGNRDLQAARARVREARARLGVRRAAEYPSTTASASATRSRGSQSTGGSGSERDFYSAGFDAGWELDIFGGVRRAVEAAAADLQATQEALNDTLVTLTAEVARNYVIVNVTRARLATAERNLALQQQTYQLTRWRAQAGLSSDLAVQQALYTLESTRARLPDLRTELEAALNRLAVLLGRPAGAVHAMLPEARSLPAVPGEILIGVPAEVLWQRPDVRQAERQLAAQTARVGVAEAERYPKLRLGGSIGLDALAFGDLFKSGSRAYSLGPSLSWTLFDGGAIRRNVDVQQALTQQQAAQYEAIVLSALEEVQNGLKAFVEEQRRAQALEAASRAAQQAADLALDQYRAGLVDFNTVLEAQRAQLSLQDSLVQSQGTIITNLIALYKALGGGWSRARVDASF